MTPADLNATIQSCVAQAVSPAVMHAIVSTESGYNQYAIGVVNGRLVRQPVNLAEAVATAKMLHERGYNFSLGLGQVNKFNLKSHGLNFETAFNPCENLRASSKILNNCYERALKQFKDSNTAQKAAFSCYYSGNFKTGFKPDFKGQPSYVNKITSKLTQSKGGIVNYSGNLTPTNQKMETEHVQSKLLF